MPRPRFSLRTLLVVVTVAAIICGTTPLIRDEYNAWQMRRIERLIGIVNIRIPPSSARPIEIRMPQSSPSSQPAPR
jgi:hypothetical protein